MNGLVRSWIDFASAGDGRPILAHQDRFWDFPSLYIHLADLQEPSAIQTLLHVLYEAQEIFVRGTSLSELKAYVEHLSSLELVFREPAGAAFDEDVTGVFGKLSEPFGVTYMYAKVIEVILAPSNADKTGMEEGKGFGDDESNPRDAYVLK